MSRWDLEHYVKITPRRKGDYGFAYISESWEDADKRNQYYAKKCYDIVENLKDHYKDFDIDTISIETNETELVLEDKLELALDTLKEVVHLNLTGLEFVNEAIEKIKGMK